MSGTFGTTEGKADRPHIVHVSHSRRRLGGQASGNKKELGTCKIGILAGGPRGVGAGLSCASPTTSTAMTTA